MFSDLSFKSTVMLISIYILFVINFMIYHDVYALPDDEGCIRIRDCPQALEHVKNVNKNYTSLRILREAHCGFIGLEPVVRCKDIPSLSKSSNNNDSCIPLSDCPSAVKLIQKHVFDLELVNKLRSLHCGGNESEPLISFALKYIKKQRYNSETIKTLQNTHCGQEDRDQGREFKVFCNRIPDFEDLPDGCVKLNECPEALRLIETRKFDPQVIKLLRSSVCGSKKNMVLCNKIKSRSIAKLRSNILRANECGLQTTTAKISRGQIAEFEDFPWLALLKYKNATGHASYRCHGTLISSRYVVTAAHCLKLTSKEKKKLGNLELVVLGEYNIKTENDCLYNKNGKAKFCTEPLQQFSPESIHIHPNFGTTGEISDIGLIRLNKSAAFSDYVKPICLPSNSLNLQIGESLFIAGWGKDKKRRTSDIKMKGRLNYLEKSLCAHYNIDITQICAGSLGNGTAPSRGESGGPLTVFRRSEDRETRSILVRIVSFGGTCGSDSAIYTNVTLFIDWIEENIYD